MSQNLRMRLAAVAMVVAVPAATAARAEDRTTLPEIIVGAPAPPNTAHQRCVDVKIGEDRSFGCLNEQLKRKVDQVNPIGNIAPLDAKSQDTRVGVINIPGVQQQYGKNFGHSVIPYRPGSPVFTSPLGPHR